MDADVRLDGATTTLDGDVINIRSFDMMLDNPGRRRGGGALRRALVHNFNDGLTLNWAADYPGGVTIEGNVLTAKALDFVLDHPSRRRAAGGPTRRALVHDYNDGLTINWASDYPGGVTINGRVQIGNTLLVSSRALGRMLDVAAELDDLRRRVSALEAR
jgi:hypothetical protein